VNETIMYSMSDPTISFPASKIAKLAKDHKDHQTTVEAIIGETACNYRAVQWATAQGYDDRSDTLDKIEKPIAELSLLLSDKINHHRLFEDGGEPALRKFCEKLPTLLENVRLAARKAHQTRGRGRPKARADLNGAYWSLERWYRRIFGDDKFTNVWDGPATELTPTSPAASFFFDVMTLIDPDQPRLAVELRELMANTVKYLRAGGPT